MKRVRAGNAGVVVEEVPELPVPEKDAVLLKVRCCGICRTDAVILTRGHRDAELGVVSGHEFVGIDECGGRHVVWPGSKPCGECQYCREGMENMCPELGIIGFDRDGGMAEFAAVPKDSLIPVPETLPDDAAVFAEPVAAAINAFSRISPSREEKRVLIVGGGTCGLLSAAVAVERGFVPVVVEREESKRRKAAEAAEIGGFQLISLEDARCEGASFDAALNACASIDGFELALKSVRPGGSVVFFGGLPKEEADFPIASMNEIHYRQLAVLGAYGCTSGQMRDALDFIAGNREFVGILIEKTITLDDVPEVLGEILSGESYRYIVKMEGTT
jgi:nicotinate-nucleotide--dimethylbenzimidazole phosphoribosyltransferase